MKYSIKLSSDDLRNLRDIDFLPINNNFCLVIRNDEIEIDTWPGAGGTYFTDTPELDNIESGDTVEILLPDGTVKLFTMPYHL